MFLMNEVEVKFIGIDEKDTVRRIKEAGGKKVFEGKIAPFLFDFPDGSLRKKNQLLRLRKKGAIVELAFKQKKQYQEAKVAEETELLVSDFDTMRKILSLMGLKEVSRRPKTRIAFATAHAHYEIDKYAGIPPYLEVEATSIRGLKKAVAAIGLSMKDAKAWSTRQVMEHYGKK